MITPTLRTALLLLTTATIALGQVDDILANTATFKPKITLSDSYSERVLAEFDGDSIFRSVVPNDERIAATVVANLDGASFGVIDENAFVGISVGNFDHSGSLGDSIDYKPGLKRATFPLTKEVFLANGDSREVRVGAVTYVWTAKTLTVTITCTDIDGAGVSDVAASDYVGTADPGTSVLIDNDPVDVLVTFGDATGERTAYMKGVTRTITQNFGSVALGTDESFDISGVTIQGAADVTGPTMKSTFPLKPNVLNKIDIAGSAEDITDVSLDSIKVNGVETAPAAMSIADDDGDGVWTWGVIGLQLKKGVNAVLLTFSDADGNESTVTKSYTIR
jgi:hypothetical protein